MITVRHIENSPAFHQWRDAFQEVTGVDIHLLDSASLESDLQKIGRSLEFCTGVGERHALCDQNRKTFAQRLREAGTQHVGIFAMRCFAGLTITALPVALADDTMAYLATGPVIIKDSAKSSAEETVMQHMRMAGCLAPDKWVSEAVCHVPVRNRYHFNATITLLRLLSQRITYMSRRTLPPSENNSADAVTVRRACEIIDNCFTEKINLPDVAKGIGVSTSHLSHLFRRQLDLTFTQYLAGRRIIEMKRLLDDSELNITEIIFAAGFQSVSQANRVFRTTTGTSPRRFRERLKN